MRVKGQLVPSAWVKDAVSQVLSWLQQFENIVICAHTGWRFDFPISLLLLKKLEKCSQFFDQVCGIELLWVYSENCFQNPHWNRLILLHNAIAKKYNAHNAIADVVTLGELLLHVNLSYQEFKQHTFSPSAVLENLDYNNAKAANISTLKVLVYAGVM